MQPYFLPYLGYFQLISCVELFVICDNFQYTRHGWINRNRYLQDGTDAIFSVPIKGDSQSKYICERQVAPEFEAAKILNLLRNAYKKSPHFDVTIDLVERILGYPDKNLFNFVANSIAQICAHLVINLKMGKTSEVSIDHSLKKEDRALALCSALGADVYVNSIGGKELYSKQNFSDRNIDLKFLQTDPIIYKQFNGEFIPSLSIVDVMMFNPLCSIRKWLESSYELV
jgi:hypothetical protein